jgi:hypothetical protein
MLKLKQRIIGSALRRHFFRLSMFKANTTQMLGIAQTPVKNCNDPEIQINTNSTIQYTHNNATPFQSTLARREEHWACPTLFCFVVVCFLCVYYVLHCVVVEVFKSGRMGAP